MQSEVWNQGSGARSQYLSPFHVLQAHGPVVVKVCSEEPWLHLPGSSSSFISCSSCRGFGKILSEERQLFSFKSFENHWRESHTLGSALLPPMWDQGRRSLGSEVRLRAFVPAGSLFPRTEFSLEGALPWPGLQGSRLCVCLLCCGGRKGVANKPSVHVGPSKHSSQNSGVGWTLGCRNL